MRRELAAVLRRLAERVSPAPRLAPVIMRAPPTPEPPEVAEPHVTEAAINVFIAAGVRTAAASLRSRAAVSLVGRHGAARAAILSAVADELDRDARTLARDASMGDA